MAETRCQDGPVEFLTAAEWQAIADALMLSHRERQVVQCILQGATEPDIATSLNISSHTVHTYLTRLYRKLNANSRADLVVRVFAAGVRIVRTLQAPMDGLVSRHPAV